MEVLSNYLAKHLFSPIQIKHKPSPDLGMVIVIPCYNEDNITGILDSLFHCQRPSCDVEVIIVVNAPEGVDNQVLEKNRLRTSDFHMWSEIHNDSHLRFYILNFDKLPAKDSGVGLARKLGMDEAVNRFLLNGNFDGVIVNIDADCTCSSNYLVSIEHEFKNKKTKACSIRFEHPVCGSEFSTENYEAIIQYELYLHYYVLSFRKTGHPFAFHTIGSSFAVRVNVYAMQGGMNKRKAGEDFYFLQKVIPLGGYTELNSACVFPSPRSSVRVPFGTGASIEKMLKMQKNIYETYDIKAFEDLECFFCMVEQMADDTKIENMLCTIKEPLNAFLFLNEFEKHIYEIRKNTASKKAFMQRFYRWFNAFIVLKYMNYSHSKFYVKQPIEKMAKEFIKKYFPDLYSSDANATKLLMDFRKIMYQ